MDIVCIAIANYHVKKNIAKTYLRAVNRPVKKLVYRFQNIYFQQKQVKYFAQRIFVDLFHYNLIRIYVYSVV